jgi:hypothetical protein
MITLADVKSSPSGWPEEEGGMYIDFELALSNLIAQYRNKYDRQKVIDGLNAQAGLLVGDDGWTKDKPDPEPEVDPIEQEPADAVDPTPDDEPTDQTAA